MAFSRQQVVDLINFLGSLEQDLPEEYIYEVLRHADTELQSINNLAQDTFISRLLRWSDTQRGLREGGRFWLRVNQQWHMLLRSRYVPT